MLNHAKEVFPGACRYRALRLPRSGILREAPPDITFPWSERHLCCVWADPEWRPAPLVTSDGRQIVVENPGRWNLEAGPDFLDAVIRTTPDEAVFRGDVEIHIRPADWRHHGHTADRRYGRVIAHVTYFDGVLPAHDLPSSILQIALRQPLRKVPSFSFDSLDVLAYPFATLSSAPPCSSLLKAWNPEQRIELLESAGEERLRLKTARLVESMSGVDPEQVLYEETMGALGYKHNRTPFQKLARILPLERLRQDSANDPIQAYALLAGISGLLPARTHPLWDDETRVFVRQLWDFWWKHQARWQPSILRRDEWVLANVRPVNSPLRRLMAASELFTGVTPPVNSLIASCTAAEPSWRTVCQLLQASGNLSYWAWHHGLAAPRNTVPSSLIGPGRAATILANVLIPWTAATTRNEISRDQLRRLPAEDDNHFARHTAHALFGHDHHPSLYHSGLRQQGLLQIFNDFCLNSRNGCQRCGLPESLSAMR
jgi:hypothetical protein